jgi:hypothetical protein
MASDWSHYNHLLKVCRRFVAIFAREVFRRISTRLVNLRGVRYWKINQSINCQRYEEFSDLLVLSRHSHSENSSVSLATNDNP